MISKIVSSWITVLIGVFSDNFDFDDWTKDNSSNEPGSN